jgi:hypothetical protein
MHTTRKILKIVAYNTNISDFSPQTELAIQIQNKSP